MVTTIQAISEHKHSEFKRFAAVTPHIFLNCELVQSNHAQRLGRWGSERIWQMICQGLEERHSEAAKSDDDASTPRTTVKSCAICCWFI